MRWPWSKPTAITGRVEMVPPPTAPRRRHRPSLRGYDAALGNRLTGGWTSTSLMADEYVRTNARTLRARARDLYRNADHARRFIHMVRSNVIGSTGVIYQARITDLVGNQDVLANKAIEAAWSLWGNPEHCDYASMSSWVEIQRHVAANLALDGEVFMRIRSVPSRAPFRFTLDTIDPDLIDADLNEEIKGGGYIRLGIEYSASDERVAYWITDVPRLSSLSTSYSANQNRTRIPASQIVHLFLREMPGQTRGIPWMATAMLRMKMLSAYEDAALMAARVGAANMGFITNANGEPPVGDAEDSSGNPEFEAEPATFRYLEPGETINSWNPKYPDGEFWPFEKACLRSISSGIGVSYNTFANDLEGVNYSSIRAGVLDEREIWKMVQDLIVSGFCRPVHRAWTSLQYDMGTIMVPTKNGPMPLSRGPLERYTQSDWQPRGWDWVDPLKDMQANALALDLRLTSRSAIMRRQGLEPDDVWAEIQRENEVLASLGIAPTPAAKPSQPEPPEQEQEPEDAPADQEEAPENEEATS